MDINLLNTNLNNQSFNDIKETRITNLLDLYYKSCNDYSNYNSKMTLSKWSLRFLRNEDLGDDINNDNYGWTLKYLFTKILELKPTSILDVGAGGGSNTKVLYSLFKKRNLNCKFYCVEHNINHYNQILDNFHNNYNINKPYIEIPKTDIEVYNIPIHDMSLSENSVELVFSHAVIAHIPYIAAVQTLKKIAKVTSKYVFHIEHKNTDQNIQIHPNTTDSINKLCIDYKKIYELLGFKTIIYEEKLLTSKQMMCIYLGEKL